LRRGGIGALSLGGVRCAEAIETLKEEKMTKEMCTLFSVNGVSYILGFAVGEMLPADMTREINQKHKQMKSDCLEYVSEAETLYQLFDK
jgi:hypothetical protein